LVGNENTGPLALTGVSALEPKTAMSETIATAAPAMIILPFLDGRTFCFFFMAVLARIGI
jgi:hypothetical protein